VGAGTVCFSVCIYSKLLEAGSQFLLSGNDRRFIAVVKNTCTLISKGRELISDVFIRDGIRLRPTLNSPAEVNGGI